MSKISMNLYGVISGDNVRRIKSIYILCCLLCKTENLPLQKETKDKPEDTKLVTYKGWRERSEKCKGMKELM